MFYNCDFYCIIILITLFLIILYNKYNKYTKNTNYNTIINEPFLAINDSQLYKDNSIDDTKPVEIKYQIPVPVNQLNDNQLNDVDSSILRNTRTLKKFSMTDELDFYQMTNILKQQKNKKYSFNYNVFPDTTIENNQLTNQIPTQTLNQIPTQTPKQTQKIIPNPKIKNSEKLITINSGAINNKDLDLNLFTRIKLELISAFNNLIISSGYYINYHPYQFFKIINSNLISFEKNKKMPNTIPTTMPNTMPIDNYCMTLTYAREYKYQQFIVYYDIDLIKPQTQNENNESNYTIVLNKVELIGIPLPNTIEFHKNSKIEREPTTSIDTELDNLKEIEESNKDYYYKDQVSDNLISDVMPNGEKSKLFQKQSIKFIDTTERSDIDLTLLDKNSITTKIDEKIMNISKDQQFKNHRCYGLVNGITQELPEYKTPIFCKSYHPEINQNGIWDAPCQVNTDCPFYKANKNYPNEYGKCNKITGSCEMPLGIVPIGFTKYGKIEPNCYNCGVNSKDNKCCGVQMDAIKQGKVKYMSPDYIFTDDENNRKQFKEEIEMLGLNINPSI